MTTRQREGSRRKQRPWALKFYSSAVGKKWVMALTGIVLLGYILSHLLGNLKVYLGPEEIDSYGEALRDLGGRLVPRTYLLWLLRIGLTAAFAVHIHAAYSLALLNRRQRPVRYESPREYLVASYASRTMVWTGTIVLLFVIFHLADLTWGAPEPASSGAFVRGAVYHNMVASFSRWPVALIYIVANLALGLHIFHGTWSLFQSIGINNPRFNRWRRGLAAGFTILVTGGNLTFPLAVLSGIVGDSGFLA